MRIFYTDGSANANNQKAGGFAFLEVSDHSIIFEKCEADYSFDVTNNKMELRAAIEAAKMVETNQHAKIHSDSQYVVKGISEWVFNWKRNNWKTSKKEPVLNQNLWEDLLLAVNQKNIQWVWVRGHANDRYNHRVDELAKKCYLTSSTR